MLRAFRNFGIAIFVCLLAAPGTAQVARDNYIWPDLDLTVLRHQTTFSGAFGLRAENNGSHVYQRRVQIGVSRMLHRRVSIGTRYLFSTSHPAEHSTMSDEHRWSIYASPWIHTKAGIVITDRNMVEFREIDGVLSYRYRNRLRIEHGFGHTAYRLTPYASLEPVYDTRWDKWSSQPRAALGVIHPFSEHVALDLSYMHQADSMPSPYRRNIVFAVLRLRY